ncbi:MAG: double-strand break repair helicase AddA [Alphaproteobacteria bacterium]
MTETRPLPPRPTPEQHRAAAPGLSAFVTASAGSGKTQVLTDRVLRLLLAGAAAQRILCITYTKAAAGEMANRVVERLAELATAGAERRHAILERLLDRAPEPLESARALRLFADVLDTPGGLKIMTIHAFCQSVLRRFPVEAGVAPQFAVIDERGAAELMAEARRRMMREPGSADVAAALSLITEQTHETQADALLGGVIAGGRLAAAAAAHGGTDGVVARIRALFGAGPDETEADALAGVVAGGGMDEAGLRRAARALIDHGTDTGRARGHFLAGFLAARPDERLALAEPYLDVWLKSDREPRKEGAQWTKAVADAQPDVAVVMPAEQTRVHVAWQHLCAVRTALQSAALVRVADRLQAVFERLKRERAALDYDDLIARTGALLGAPGRAPWVLYKLDGGLDHVLIDEAQDTNHPQWDIARDLTGEFFAGEGAHDAEADARSLFAVGDVKQSIYSFQGADPDAFAAAAIHFAGKVRAARQAWADITLDRSFRSTAAVLSAVDAVFNGSDARIGLGLADEARLRHRVTREGAAGLVELWPLVEAPEAEETEHWRPPVEPEPGESPKAMLARRIARRIQRMVGHEMLEARGRPVRAGDVLVLVRRRDALVEELIRQLKELGIPVAGRDRLKLTEHLAVMDLMALGEAMLLPEDDLTLATVLRSPLVGYGEDELFALAYDRGARSLWARLGELARADRASVHGRAFAWLHGLRARADYVTPFAFYDRLLNDLDDPRATPRPLSGRARLIARLGRDAADPIDEFLALVQEEERREPPSLQGLLFRLRTSDVEIKRELEQGGADAVRVMTVHGAKGLQAPVVFLPDTVAAPVERSPLRWHAVDGGVPVPLWLRGRDRDDPVARQARQAGDARMREEYHRLLYVAMTRAEDRLYVAGAAGKRTAADGCWYRLIEAGLADALQPADDGELGPVRRLSCPQTAAVEPERPQAAAPVPEPLPDWARRPAPPEPHPPRPLAPSRPAEADAPVRSPLDVAEATGAWGRGWGIAAHRLLQRLPELAAEVRATAAARYLAANRPDWSDDARAALAAEVLAILDDPAFAPLFGPGSLAEAPIVAVLPGGVVVAGQVDRLLVGPDRVLVVDFKTNRRPPAGVGAVPAVYRQQMAAYRAALAQMFPDRPVDCALLWTDGPLLMPLPADILGFPGAAGGSLDPAPGRS